MLNRGFHKHFLFSNRTTRRALQLAALLLMTAGSGAMAAEWYAAPNGSGSDCTQASPCTIQGAIDKADEYDTVHVASGDYSFTSNRIVIDKAGLKLIGETSPFDKPYAENPGPGEIAYGTMDNVAPDAVRLKAATQNKSGTSGMIWVKNVPDVEIRNLYVEVVGRTKEGIVATGAVNGLKLDNNYVKAVGGTSILGISINLTAGGDSSVPSGESRASAQYVEITNNVIEPTEGNVITGSVFKRALAMQNSAGLLEGNQVAGHTQDMWLQSSKGGNNYPLNIKDNWFFGRLQVYLSGRSGLTENIIEGNHFEMAQVLNAGSGSSGYGNGSEAQGLRIMGNGNVPAVARNNFFNGFGGPFRALWVQNASETVIEGNVFTPESGQSDFTAIAVGNREVWNGLPAPRAFDVTIRGNTFHANGVTSGNKGKAILFVNDNDGNNDATFTKAVVGGTDAVDGNNFDSDIGWYIALDDRSCINTQNHTGSGCDGTASYPIGLAIAYNGGSNASSTKRPFKWDIQAEGNSFGGVAMADMDEAEFDAIMDKTWASHNATTAPNEVGQVLYNWTPPLITTGTIELDQDELFYDGSAQALSATLAEDSSAVCTLTPDTVTEVGSHDINAHCVGDTHDVSDTLQVTVYKADQSITDFEASIANPVVSDGFFTVSASSSSGEPVSFGGSTAGVCSIGGSTVSIEGVGTCELTADQGGNANYNAAPQATLSVEIGKASGVIAWGPLDFDYTAGASHALSATVEGDPNSSCAVSPDSVGPQAGSWTVTASNCSSDLFDVTGLSDTATATVRGATAASVVETGKSFATVADALADADTEDGMTVELAPGVYPGSIKLTRSVTLTGASQMDMSSTGPSTPPGTVIDGTSPGAGSVGIEVASGIQDVTITGIEIRNFTGDCIHARRGNSRLRIQDNHTHHCGGQGAIYINGHGDTEDVVIERNEMHDAARGIIVWNGPKLDFTIANNFIHGPNLPSGIIFNDGTATGVEIIGNRIENTETTGIAVLQPTSGSPSSRANRFEDNELINPGRYGLALHMPNGSGAESGDGAILVQNNIVKGVSEDGSPTNLGDPNANLADSDRAGISVVRRFYTGASQGQVDETRGVIVRGNLIRDLSETGTTQQEAYGLALEGTRHTVLDNVSQAHQL